MQIFQWILFALLLGVSSFFTVLLALGLGITPVEKLVLVLGSLGIEGLKTYALIAANTAVLEKLRTRALGLYSVYGFVAIYSLSACLGYALVTVDRMTSASTVLLHKEEIETQQKALANYEEQISTLRTIVSTQQNTLKQPADDKNIYQRTLARKGIADNLAKIDSYITKKNETLAKITEWREKDLTSSATTRKSLYEVIGQAINIKTASVEFIILLIFSLAIELGIFLTSPHGTIHTTIKQAEPTPEPLPEVSSQPRTKHRSRKITGMVSTTNLPITSNEPNDTHIAGPRQSEQVDPPTPIVRQT